jgi:cellulose synthase operon protein C
LAIELDAASLTRWVTRRLAGILGTKPPTVWVAVRAAGATIGLYDSAETSPPRILAFDIALDAQGDDLRLYIHGARGSGLPSPAAGLAIRSVHEAVGSWATRIGSSFALRAVPRAVTRALLPEAGLRAPDASGVRFTGLGAEDDAWLLFAEDTGASADVSVEAARAREAADIANEVDDALFAEDYETARELAVAALERAPRHRELSRRIADIDRVAGGRAEAALATLVEADRGEHLPLGTGRDSDRDGLLVAELLAEIGDTDAAVATFVRMGEVEPVPALAARAFERAAELTLDPHDALVWLDMAVARAPAMARIRWARLARRLKAGRIEDALADAEHLEAQARGTHARHAVWKRAGEAWNDAGRGSEAAALYERALRFDPRDIEAIAGLGRALLASHRPARGTALLARAIDLAAARGEAVPTLVLELGTALAEAMDDRPAAIARARAIASDAPEAIRARGLEGRWRAQIGDIAGASFAFARMRELADVRVSGKGGIGAGDIAALLVEAAGFERTVREDLLAAQRHLASALRLAPEDTVAREAYRAVGARIAGGNRPLEVSADESSSARGQQERHPHPTDRPRGVPLDLSLPTHAESDDSAMDGDSVDAARVEDLTRSLNLNPNNDEVVDELSTLLLRLGRGHELLALLAGRLEEAAPERRAVLLPKQREALKGLSQEARRAGRPEEAALFEDMLASLGEPQGS